MQLFGVVTVAQTGNISTSVSLFFCRQVFVALLSSGQMYLGSLMTRQTMNLSSEPIKLARSCLSSEHMLIMTRREENLGLLVRRCANSSLSLLIEDTSSFPISIQLSTEAT